MALMSVLPVAFKTMNGVCIFDDTVVSPRAFWSFIFVTDYLLPLATREPVKQITTAAVTEGVWGEYVFVVCQILAKRDTKMSEI